MLDYSELSDPKENAIDKKGMLRNGQKFKHSLDSEEGEMIAFMDYFKPNNYLPTSERSESK